MRRSRSGKKYVSGQYRVINTGKYAGRNSIATYRSSWERRAFVVLDNSNKIQRWGSENIEIPYHDPIRGGVHRYVVDLFIEYVNEKTGKTERCLVEIKPSAQTIPPVRGRKKSATYMRECFTYIINVSKWKACQKYCQSKGWQFKILTEKNCESFVG
jgi:hypothetical protein